MRDLKPRASTPGFPEEFNCSAVGTRVRAADPDGSGRIRFARWSTVATLPTGRVHVSVMPITNQTQDLGFAILLHDLSFIERREAQARTFLFVIFGILGHHGFRGADVGRQDGPATTGAANCAACCAAAGSTSREFQPILSDVRELVSRMANDREDAPGLWTAERLKQTLNRHLHGEKIVILANREPYIHEYTARWRDRGSTSRERPGHRARTGDARLLRRLGRPRQRQRRSRDRGPQGSRPRAARRRVLSHPPGVALRGGGAGLLLRLLQRRALAALPRRPRAAGVPRRGLAAVPARSTRSSPTRSASEVDSNDPIILVQDYHFALAPAMIRKRLPAATVIMFWHIPWPNAENIGICPWRNEILEGLLGSSILGFHTQLHCNNFLDSVDRYLETRIDRETQRGRDAGASHADPPLSHLARMAGPLGRRRRPVPRSAARRCGAIWA